MSKIKEEMKTARHKMVREITRCMASVAPKLPLGAISPRILDVLGELPRHLFVQPEHLSEAYLNRPVAIGYGQTISQPFIVALMTDLLDLEPGDTVLEIGTGSGYQTAVLSRLVEQVYTIEICEPLAQRAAATFERLGLPNIHARVGDGHSGWPEAAPFDAILVAAAPAEVPEPLIAQLKPGGRLVMPVGDVAQQLIVVEKQSDHTSVLREIIPVCFVPLTRQDTPPYQD